jgi:hypothetical protein
MTTIDDKDCNCFMLQSVDTKPVVIVYHHPVLTLGLLAAFLLVVVMLCLAIYVRPKPPLRTHQENIMDIDSDTAH